MKDVPRNVLRPGRRDHHVAGRPGTQERQRADRRSSRQRRRHRRSSSARRRELGVGVPRTGPRPVVTACRNLHGPPVRASPAAVRGDESALVRVGPGKDPRPGKTRGGDDRGQPRPSRKRRLGRHLSVHRVRIRAQCQLDPTPATLPQLLERQLADGFRWRQRGGSLPRPLNRRAGRRRARAVQDPPHTAAPPSDRGAGAGGRGQGEAPVVDALGGRLLLGPGVLRQHH
jgi:hypothetical protein